ncbi:SgrR family transcriptional regulator [Enterobacter cloacae subsp. cloacae]|uniref:SgrR family transcriptional regulator n=1 Tax=Enterobacter cloacae TaxID=550 RepID=UPI001C5B427C|nr:SgrR family transcriptional regulator [Enterobacter cloacae]MBW4204101.1 SgrR family transcriptional regulator [Enterobacter cloacae subsp. cloacae]
MRQLQRARQYQRLLKRYGTHPVRTSITEVAEVLLCSERHARNVLRQLQQAGWLTWSASPGRGHRAGLHCVRPFSDIAGPLLTHLLGKGDYQNALQLAEGDPGYLSHILAPFLGGRWQKRLPTLRIPYYRSLRSFLPDVASGRAERHISSHLYSGLTRYATGSDEPVPDLAHHWYHSQDACQWFFGLHYRLHWHNGQPVEAGQLLHALKMAISRPGAHSLAGHVTGAELCGNYGLRLTLSRPDYFLAHRLAHPLLRLVHPSDPETGCGPFMLSRHETHFLRLESHPWYHLSRPAVHAVEFWITENPAGATPGNSNPALITVGDKTATGNRLPPSAGANSRGFTCVALNSQRSGMTSAHRRWLLSCCRHLARELCRYNDHIYPSFTALKRTPDWQTENRTGTIPDDFPRTLTITCVPVPEATALQALLTRELESQGFQVNTVSPDLRSWHAGTCPESADILFGEFGGEGLSVMAEEEWFLTDPVWRAILPGDVRDRVRRLLDRQSTERARIRVLALLEPLLARGDILSPLIRYRYRVLSLPGVAGIELMTNGWFDFTRVWVLPEEE